MLGCAFGEDSLEHYSTCWVAFSFGRDFLGLECRFSERKEYWFLTAPEDADMRSGTWWRRLALLQYAVMRVTNACRVQGRLAPREVRRALRQAMQQGAQGHRLEKVLHGFGTVEMAA